MSDTTLVAIRNKFRQITATPSNTQLSNTEVDEYINTYYLYDFPAELQLLKLKTNYSFFTKPNVDQYDAPIETYTSFDTPVYVGGFEQRLYQDQTIFYAEYPKTEFKTTVGTGDGTNTTPPLTSLSSVPVYPFSVYVTATIGGNSVTYNDNGSGGFTGATGTINYTTGALTLDWGTPPDSGTSIEASAVVYTAGRPLAILYYDSKFIVRPGPDKAYKIELQAFVRPTDLLAVGTSPQLKQWWQLLAIGGAMKFFEDNDDLESISRYTPIMDNQLKLVNRRTIMQNSEKEILTPFSHQGEGLNYGFFGSFQGG